MINPSPLQSYRQLHLSACALLQKAGLPLLGLLLLYKVATVLLFIPAMQLLWALTLRFAPIRYLNNSSAGQIYRSPAILCGIALIVILTAFWVLYGFSLLLHALSAVQQGKRIRLSLLGGSLSAIRHALLPRNWVLLLYCITLIPFTGFFLAWSHVTQFAVPEYLLRVLWARPVMRLWAAAALLVILSLFFFWTKILPYFTLEGKNAVQSARESFRFFRRHPVQLSCLTVRWVLGAFLGAALPALSVIALLYALVLGVGMRSSSGMLALSRAMLLVEMPFWGFFIDCAMTLSLCLLFTLLHEAPTESVQMPSQKQFSSLYRKLVSAALVGPAVLTLALSMVYYTLPAKDSLRTVLGGAVPIVTAHRGYSSAAPENTLAAFQAAINSGSERAELDVQMTKDGVVMVTHDTSLRRCTGTSANIYDLTCEQVQQLSAGRWFGARFAAEKVPTLEEVLDLCQGKIQLNVEIKPNAATPRLEEETVRLLKEKGFIGSCVVTSQSYETLCRVKELAPEIPTGYILALGVGSCYDLPAADFFSIESTFITASMVKQIHLRGKTVSAWTINREQDASNLLKLGVDDLITDKPEMVQQLLDRTSDEDSRLLSLRDSLRSLLGSAEETAGPDPEDEVIEEAIQDPEEVLDEA